MKSDSQNKVKIRFNDSTVSTPEYVNILDDNRQFIVVHNGDVMIGTHSSGDMFLANGKYRKVEAWVEFEETSDYARP